MLFDLNVKENEYKVFLSSTFDVPRFKTLWKSEKSRLIVSNLTVKYFYLVNWTKYCGGTTLVTLAAKNKNLVLKKMIACDKENVFLA